jgi:phage shock protein C
MSAPYSAPRRLERSRSDRFIGGVCGGIAKYLNMDPTLVRILTVVITLFTGVPIVAYLIALLVMPEEPAAGVDYPPVNGAGTQPSYPTYPANGKQDPVWGSAGAPWEQPQSAQPAQPAQSAQPTQSAQPSQPVWPAETTQPVDPAAAPSDAAPTEQQTPR